MNRNLLIALTLLLALACIVPPASYGQMGKKERHPIMQQKLEDAKGILEGIALKDFPLIEKHAGNLLALTAKEEWMIFPTAEYKRWTNQFREDVEMIAGEAKAKNLDGAVLGYVQMTTSCVNCHKRVREIRMVNLETFPGKGPELLPTAAKALTLAPRITLTGHTTAIANTDLGQTGGLMQDLGTASLMGCWVAKGPTPHDDIVFTFRFEKDGTFFQYLTISGRALGPVEGR